MNLPNTDALEFVEHDLPYFRFQRLSLFPEIRHGIFTRCGGVSPAPFATLNVGDSVGDRPENVKTNLKKIRRVFGAESMVQMNQAHGCGILVIRQDIYHGALRYPLADAVITDACGVVLLVKQADCQGVIVYDPHKKIIANVHCGWRGNVQNILGRVVLTMKREFGCKGSDLVAAIGPSLGPCCAEFSDYEHLFPEIFYNFLVLENHMNLWAVSRRQLQEAGLHGQNIEIAGICTRCTTDWFYSFRGEGRTGRFGSVVMLC